MKNTRLVYIDKKNLDVYNGLDPEEFKEFFMKYFTYQLGDNVEKSDFSSSALFSLFKSYKEEKIDPNEEKYEEIAKRNKENGKKSMGRPRKVIFENKDAINNIVSLFVGGKEQKANEMLGVLISKLGYNPSDENDEGANYILNYVENEIERATK